MRFAGEEVMEVKVVMILFFQAKWRFFYALGLVRLVEQNFFDEPARGTNYSSRRGCEGPNIAL